MRHPYHNCMDYRYGKYAENYERARESEFFVCPGCGRKWRLGSDGPGRAWEEVGGPTMEIDPIKDDEARRQMYHELYGYPI